MFYRLCAFLIIFFATTPCRAEKTFVVEIRVELTDGTGISDAEVTAYRNGKRLDEKKKETRVGGHYRFDSLPEGDPVFFMTEYHRAPGKPHVKFVPHVVRSLSGRKQQFDGQIPVVMMSVDEAKKSMTLSSAIGHVEDAYRLMAGTRDFAERSKSYQELLDELAQGWAQDDVKVAWENDPDGYKLLGGKLNALASQFRKESPVVSTESMTFPIVADFKPETIPTLVLPDENSFTIVDNMFKAWWKPHGNNQTFQAIKVKGYDPSTTSFCNHTAGISRRAPYVFMLNDGKIQSMLGDQKSKTIDHAGSAKRIFVAPGGNVVGAWEPEGNVTFYMLENEQWSKATNMTVVTPVENWAFSQDGTKFAFSSGTFSDGRVNIFDIKSRRLLNSLSFPDGASGVAFDDDVTGVYVSSRLKDVVRKYDIETGQPNSAEHIVPDLFGPLGWDAEKKSIRVPTISGEIKAFKN